MKGHINVCDSAAFDNIVKGAVAGNLDLHASSELRKYPRVAFYFLFRNLMALYSQVPFFTIPQRFLQAFHRVKGGENLSAFGSCHHIRLDALL